MKIDSFPLVKPLAGCINASLAVIFLLLPASGAPPTLPSIDPAAAPASLDTANLGFDEIVFVKRKPYSSDHYYTDINNGTSADRFLPSNGIYVYNLRTRSERAVVTAAEMPGGKGFIGKISLSFDARTDGMAGATAIYNAAVEMWNAGNLEATVLALDKAIGMAPEMAELYQLKGRALIAQEQMEAGIESLQKYLSLVGDDDPAAEADRALVKALGGGS